MTGQITCVCNLLLSEVLIFPCTEHTSELWNYFYSIWGFCCVFFFNYYYFGVVLGYFLLFGIFLSQIYSRQLQFTDSSIGTSTLWTGRRHSLPKIWSTCAGSGNASGSHSIHSSSASMHPWSLHTEEHSLFLFSLQSNKNSSFSFSFFILLFTREMNYSHSPGILR